MTDISSSPQLHSNCKDSSVKLKDIITTSLGDISQAHGNRVIDIVINLKNKIKNRSVKNVRLKTVDKYIRHGRHHNRGSK